jgi:CRP-like cAMP-binding protein
MDITAKQFQSRFKALATQFSSPADIDVLLQNCTLTQVPSGTRIITHRGSVSALYLVWSGLLAASIEEGDIHLELGDIRPGQWVGEVTLIDPGPANASVTTTEDSQLLALSHDAFNRLRETHPAVAGALLRALCLNITERLRPTGERVIDQIGSHAYRLHDLPPDEKAKGFRQITSLLVGLLGTHPGGANGHQ